MPLMGGLPGSGIVDTVRVDVFLAVQDGCFHAVGDRGNNFQRPEHVPTDKDPVFPYDRCNRFH